MNHSLLRATIAGLSGTLILACILLAPHLTEAGGGGYVGTQKITASTTIPETGNGSNGDTLYIDATSTVTATGSATQFVPVPNLWYAWNRGQSTTHDGENTPDTTTEGWVYALTNPQVTIAYNVAVYDHATQTLIPQGGNIAAGQKVDLVFSKLGSRDISWFGSGYSMDSPYGKWVAGAAAPARSGGAVSCDPDDFVIKYQNQSNIGNLNYDVYVPLSVAPTTRLVTVPPGFTSCSALTSKGDGTIAGVSDGGSTLVETCTAPSTIGTTTPTFNFGSTTGQFFYRYYDYRDMSASGWGPPGCYGNNIPLSTGSSAMQSAVPPTYNNDPTMYSGYQMSVSPKAVPYTLQVTPSTNNPPSTPILTCPSSGVTGQSLSFTASSTDPDGNQIRYGMNDWMGSTTVTQYVPASGYVNSGVAQTVTHVWNSAGTYTVEALAEDTYGAQSAWASCPVTITSATAPNLTAGLVSPTSATAGTAATFSATISNTNATSTGASFTNLFQTATDSTGSNATDVATSTMSALAGNANASATHSYTFPLADGGTTQYMRVCADKSSAGDANGVIVEANETDNCGTWTAIAVGGTSAPTCSLKASPNPISVGQSSVLTWSAPGATSCQFADEGTSRGASGTRPVSPGTTSSYSVTCTNSAGQCTIPVTVTVGPAPCTAVPVTLSATPGRVKQGNMATLAWTIPQVDQSVSQCTITAPNGFSYTIPVTSCAVPGGASSTPSNAITTQTTFTLTCGSAMSQTIVDVIPAIKPF